MNNMIELYNVRTHNLKNISVSIPKNKITAIYGRSGAGKSSLAFSTLHQLCFDEFDALENGFNDNQDYSLSGYDGIIPSVAINNINKNNNPRSTLYSFLNMAQIISSLRLDKPIPYSLLKLNKPQNECIVCGGLGEIAKVSDNQLIEENKTILENPFKIWQHGYLSELYYKLMLAFCDEESIPVNQAYSALSEGAKNKLLYGKSKTKISVRYKHNGKYRQKKLFYTGMMLSAESKLNFGTMSEFKQVNVCSCCKGSRVNKDTYENITLGGCNFIDLLNMPIFELKEKFKNLDKFSYLNKVLTGICEIGLGYLSLSRSIPSLSGGELQKLKFSKVLNSGISGVLIVIDEISSQLSDDSYQMILQKLKELAKKNTVVLVEHNRYFIEQADYRLHIGKFAGNAGGYVCEPEIIAEIDSDINLGVSNSFFEFTHINKHNICNQSVNIPKKLVSVLTGVSGSGKSSLAKWIESNQHAIYVTQKNSNYSSRSVLASSLKVNTMIADYFSEHTGLSAEEFLLHKNAGCRVCNGTGILKYERGFDKDLYLNCYKCEGKLFDDSNPAIYEKLNGLSLVDFYHTEITDLLSLLPSSLVGLINVLKTVEDLGLGYLTLARKTQTLSTGESRRLKLSEHLARQKETKKILIIDEPVAGLDPETASKVANFIRQRSNLFSAVILVEHRKEAIKYADYEIRMGPFAGVNGGRVMSQRFLNDKQRVLGAKSTSLSAASSFGNNL